MFIDTHSHIYEEEFREDRTATVQRALEANVKYIILPDIDSESRGRRLLLFHMQIIPDILRTSGETPPVSQYLHGHGNTESNAYNNCTMNPDHSPHSVH